MKALLVTVLLLISFPALSQSADRDLYQQAEIRFRNGDYELALDRYQALVRDYPFSRLVPDAQFRIGVTQNRLGRYRDAIRTFTRVETRFRSTQYLDLIPFWKGVTRYHLEEFSAAVEELDEFLQDDVGTDLARQALLYRALSEDSLGEDPREDVERLLELADNPSEEPYATAILMRSLMRDSEFDRTISLYESLEPEELDDMWRERIQLYAAEAYRGIGEDERALELYRGLEDADADIAVTAFQRQFQYAQERGDTAEVDRVVRGAEVTLRGRTDVLTAFWQQIGIDNFQRERFDLAELYLSRVWELRDRVSVGATVPLYLAEIRIARGREDRAIELLETQLEQASDDDENVPDDHERLLVRLGGIHLMQEDFEQAAERFDQSLQQFPEGELAAQAAYQKAFSLFQLGQFDETLEVISDANSRGMSGGFSREMRRLQAGAYRQVDDIDGSIDSYRSYLAETPDDIDTRLEYAKVLFLADRYERINEQITELYDRAPDLADESPGLFLQAEYLEGLSRVGRRQYEQAIVALESFEGIEDVRNVDAEDAGLESIYPYSLYYRGWAHYRLGEWDTATDILTQVVDYDSDHELAPRSAYIAGWSAYSGEEYETARDILTRLRGLGAPEEMDIEGRYLLAQVYQALENYESAETELGGIYEAFPDSQYAPEALSAHADILADRGETDAAVERYHRVFQRYPDHQLATEALYKRGEVLFTNEEYERARDAWLEFRSEASEDNRLYAASLYRSGQASRELEQTGAALLVLNRLIDNFRDSAYRFDAMAGAAELYEQRGEFREALNLYTEIVGTYPDLAEEISAQDRADELVLRLGGLNEQEASLLVQIEQGRRAATEEGREAIIELSRLVIYESVAESVNRRLVLPLLRETAGRKDEAPEQAAEAQFLIGEWYHQQEEYEDAAEAFLEAAGVYPQDRDLSAQSLYRAVASYRQRGNRTAEIREIVETMQDEFPGSEWTAEAESVLEAL